MAGNDVTITIGLDSAGAVTGLKQVSSETDKVGTSADTAGEHVGRLGGALSSMSQIAGGIILAKVFQAGTDAIKDGLSSVLDYQKLQAQTATVLKSTGDASGQTSESIKALAESLSGMSGVQDETIQKSENMLLTFTNIGGSTFPAATKAILDMSSSFSAAGKSMDISDIAIQVGKALNDPVKGVTALQRVGVTFTASQKDVIASMVATGNTAGAQGVILAELNKEFGGSAEAAGKTLSGQLNILKNTFADLARDGLMVVIPPLTSLATMLATDLVRGVDAAKGPISDVYGALKDLAGVGLDKISGPITDFATHLVDLSKAETPKIFAALTDFVKGDVVPKLQSLGAAFAQIADAKFDQVTKFWDSLSANQKHIVEATAAFGAMGLAVSTIVTYWGPISDGLTKFGAALKPVIDALTPFVDRILVDLKTQFDSIVTALKPLGDSLGQLLTALKPLEPLIKPLAEAIGVVLVGALILILVQIDLFVKAMTIAMVGAINAVTAAINIATPIIKGIVDAFAFIVTQLATYVPQFLQKGTDLIAGLLKGITDKFFDVTHWFEDAGSKIENAIGDMGHLLYSAGAAVIQGFFDGLVSVWGNVADWVSSRASWISDHKGPLSADAVLLYPSGVAVMTGFAAGMKDGFDSAVAPVVTAAADAVQAAMKSGLATLATLASGGGLPSGTSAADASGVTGNAILAAMGFDPAKGYTTTMPLAPMTSGELWMLQNGIGGVPGGATNAALVGGVTASGIQTPSSSGPTYGAASTNPNGYHIDAATGRLVPNSGSSPTLVNVTVNVAGDADAPKVVDAINKWWTQQTTIAAVQAGAV